MGRNAVVLFRDPISGKLFVRFYENGKNLRLAADTADDAEAVSAACCYEFESELAEISKVNRCFD